MDTNDSKKPIQLNENDPIEVNNLITLADSDITTDLLAQLESRAMEEQEKIGFGQDEPEVLQTQEITAEPESELQQSDIEIQQGLPAGDGAVNVTGEIIERTVEPGLKPELPSAEEAMNILEEAKMNAVYKKYVVYIDKNNEHFIDSLTIQERKDLINKVLKEQNTLTIEQRKEKKRIERTIKVALALVTFTIAIPVFYLIFNVCMEATIQNYRHSRSNFEVLYKETGKIKMK